MLRRVGLVIAVVVLFGAISSMMPAKAHEDNDQEQETVAQVETNNETKQQSAAYDYVAQAGDSYSVLARKAVQTYGIETGANLSGAQIVFAETHLTQAAGSLALNEGQDVSIDKDDVKQIVQDAQELSDSEETAWDYYVQFVDFDTSNNGESS